jgi:hypothetical protein
MEANPAANAIGRAVISAAALGIIDSGAVADIKNPGRAKPPNRKLDGSRAVGGADRVELAGVDLPGDVGDDVGTTAGQVAARPELVAGAVGFEGAGSMHEVVNQGVDRHHVAADFGPLLSLRIGTEQDVAERHTDQLGGNAEDPFHRGERDCPEPC